MTTKLETIEAAFQVGGIVSGDLFYNREELINEILLELRGLKRGIQPKIVLIGPRQIGKSSIILNVKEKLAKEKFICVYIDCFCIYPFSLENFLENYSEKLYIAASEVLGWKLIPLKIREAIEGSGEALLKITKKVGFGVKGIEIWSEFREKKVNEKTLIERVLNALQEISEKFNKPVIVFIDELQKLAEFGEDFLNYFRSIIYHGTKVGYLVAGSAVGIMKKIVEKERSPFFKLFGGSQIRRTNSKKRC